MNKGGKKDLKLPPPKLRNTQLFATGKENHENVLKLKREWISEVKQLVSFLLCFSQTLSKIDRAVLWRSAVSFFFYPRTPLVISTLCSLQARIMRLDDTPSLSTLELKMTLVALKIKYPKTQKQLEKRNHLQSFVLYLLAYKFIPIWVWNTIDKLQYFWTTEPAFTSFSVLNGLPTSRQIPWEINNLVVPSR